MEEKDSKLHRRIRRHEVEQSERAVEEKKASQPIRKRIRIHETEPKEKSTDEGVLHRKRVRERIGLNGGEVQKTSPKNVRERKGIQEQQEDSMDMFMLDSDYLKSLEEYRITAMVEEISRNVEKRIAEEEAKIKEEMKKTTKAEKKAKNKGKKIKSAKTIHHERLTEPKKRILLNRLMLRIKYDKGYYEDIEDWYNAGEITKKEVEESRTAPKRRDRSFYKEVQQYEDVIEDVRVKNGWLAFKTGLAVVLLSATIALGHSAYQQFNEIMDSFTQVNQVVTIENASEEQKQNVQDRINQIKELSGYEFSNLTEEELIDAALRIPVIQKDMYPSLFTSAFLNMKDQELLEEMLQRAYGEEEFATYTPEKVQDLKKLAYELLGSDKEKQEYIRDPQKVAEILEKKEAQEATQSTNVEREVGD